MTHVTKKHRGSEPVRARRPPVVRRPAARSTGLTAESVLDLQRSAGNRAVSGILQRTGAEPARPAPPVPVVQRGEFVLEQSIGPEYISKLGLAGIRREAAVITQALRGGKLDPTAKQTAELNLEELEDYAAGEGLAVPEATGHRLRTVLTALAGDIKSMAEGLRPLIPSDPFVGVAIPGDIDWSLGWLDKSADMLVDGQAAVIRGEAGGPDSEREFARATQLVTGAIPITKAVAVHLAYLTVVTQVEKHFPNSWSSDMNKNLEMVRDELTPLMSTVHSGGPAGFDTAVGALMSSIASWKFPFSQFVDEMTEKMRKRTRVLQWIGIAQLALLAFDIWMLPVAGGGIGPKAPPKIGGGGVGGGATAVSGGGVLVSVESLEALRRLIRLGVMANPALVVAVGGGGPLATPKPMHAEPPKGKGQAGGPAGGTKAPAGGSAKKLDPKDPQWRPEPGLPSRAEDALVKEYATALKDLSDRRAALGRAEASRLADPKKYDRAVAAMKSADQRLAALEDKALKMGGEAVEHLGPLTSLRDTIRGGNLDTGLGVAVRADALKGMPKDLRYKDFAEVEKVLHRPPNEVTAVTKTAPGDTAGGHQRLTWKFEDGSMLIADRPGPRPAGSTRPVSADRPHVEFHGPKGQRLDEQGIAVPERSVASHITVTDQLGRMEALFAAARKGK